MQRGTSARHVIVRPSPTLARGARSESISSQLVGWDEAQRIPPFPAEQGSDIRTTTTDSTTRSPATCLLATYFVLTEHKRVTPKLSTHLVTKEADNRNICETVLTQCFLDFRKRKKRIAARPWHKFMWKSCIARRRETDERSPIGQLQNGRLKMHRSFPKVACSKDQHLIADSYPRYSLHTKCLSDLYYWFSVKPLSSIDIS